jgi:plastocyanin
MTTIYMVDPAVALSGVGPAVVMGELVTSRPPRRGSIPDESICSTVPSHDRVQSSSTGSPPSTAPPPTTPPPSGSTATVTTPNATFSPSDITIAAGGSVTWQFSEARHNVTFQGTAPTGGNVPDQDPGTSASRTFPLAGTYNYSCTRHSGMTGRVIVQ